MKVAIFWGFGKELKSFMTKTVSVVFDVQMNFATFSEHSFKSYEGPLSGMLVRISESGLKGQSSVFKKSGPFTQPLSFRAYVVISRVPVSSGLSPLNTSNHSSIVVDSRISETRLATKTGNLLVEFNHCRTVVLSVHMHDSFIFTFKDFLISSLRRHASNAACISSLALKDFSLVVL